MIYSDELSSQDEEDMPARRKRELCLNCSKDWNRHNGWACENDEEQCFSNLASDERYLTRSMKDSIGLPKEIQKNNIPTQSGIDLSNWKLWAHNHEGDCVCGIRRDMCDYHRG